MSLMLSFVGWASWYLLLCTWLLPSKPEGPFSACQGSLECYGKVTSSAPSTIFSLTWLSLQFCKKRCNEDLGKSNLLMGPQCLLALSQSDTPTFLAALNLEALTSQRLQGRERCAVSARFVIPDFTLAAWNPFHPLSWKSGHYLIGMMFLWS